VYPAIAVHAVHNVESHHARLVEDAQEL